MVQKHYTFSQSVKVNILSWCTIFIDGNGSFTNQGWLEGFVFPSSNASPGFLHPMYQEQVPPFKTQVFHSYCTKTWQILFLKVSRLQRAPPTHWNTLRTHTHAQTIQSMFTFKVSSQLCRQTTDGIIFFCDTLLIFNDRESQKKPTEEPRSFKKIQQIKKFLIF